MVELSIIYSFACHAYFIILLPYEDHLFYINPSIACKYIPSVFAKYISNCPFEM